MDHPGLQFIDQPVEVIFDSPPALEKTPPCPNGFTWRGETNRVEEMLAEWSDFSRRGKMANNMTPEHAARAAGKGSWGVGRFYFRASVWVRVDHSPCRSMFSCSWRSSSDRWMGYFVTILQAYQYQLFRLAKFKKTLRKA
jgi:hypothetical protein